MDESKNLKVSIYGEIYSLVSDQSEQHLLEASSRVDRMMKEVAEATGLQDAKRVAVLVSLRLMSAMLQTEASQQRSAVYYQKLTQKIDQTLGS